MPTFRARERNERIAVQLLLLLPMQGMSDAWMTGKNRERERLVVQTRDYRHRLLLAYRSTINQSHIVLRTSKSVLLYRLVYTWYTILSTGIYVQLCTTSSDTSSSSNVQSMWVVNTTIVYTRLVHTIPVARVYCCTSKLRSTNTNLGKKLKLLEYFVPGTTAVLLHCCCCCCILILLS